MLRAIIPFLFIALATPTLAQDDADWRFGGDAYLAGRTVTLSGEAVDDLFAAGDKVTARTEIGGSAHMAGRYVTLMSRVGENFYGAGMEVDVEAPVAGDVTIMGQRLTITEPVSGDVRATGSRIRLDAPVAGNALLAGETITLNAAIMGDLALATPDVSWGDAASVAGEVHIYTDDPDNVDVPERVASADRVTFHPARAFDAVDGDVLQERPGFFTRLRGWLGGILAVGLIGTLFGAIAPKQLAALRERALDRPLRTGLLGFAGLSALVGSVVFLAMTGIGIVVIPVALIAAVLLGIGGYVVGTYSIGVWATAVAGRPMPKSIGDRALAAFSGAAIGALIGLIPWLGWLAVMAIFLVGAGAVVVRITRPAFGVEPAA
ncbi:hypothetical protein [Sinisalibacter lacisalsi]|uniref:DUF8173 domain-containing protein n=1 Tax=Sinisalibacter lacisalsi TaxID=1526570 RepID=A0ABQ1QW67_9RHOB|nr:hypothetical protein [Sinisalibacter lacisalsi]GGD46976.1 hypothetical protein GCM10011358_33420 [Sinisalibacter lacisalsi]